MDYTKNATEFARKTTICAKKGMVGKNLIY